MRKLKTVGIWVIISLILQCGLYLYLDKFFFVSETNFKTKKVENNDKNTYATAEISIPQNATNITVSYTGKYVAFYEGDKLEVINSQTSEKDTISLDKDEKISYFKWLPDRDRIMMAISKKNKQVESIKFYSYDVKIRERIEIRDNHDREVSIQLPDSKSKVDEIALSTLTSVIYVKVSHAGSRHSLYRMNIMGQTEKIKTPSYFIGSIQILNRQDKMIFEDLTKKASEVKVTGISNTFKISGAEATVLLGVDNEDKVYLGEVKNNEIVKVYYGDLETPINQWENIALSQPAAKGDIYISALGKIYVNDNMKGVVTDIRSSQGSAYKGNFLEFYNGGIASISGGKLVKVPFR